MINRRDFLSAQIGAALVLGTGTGFAATPARPSGAVLALDRLVVDDRYPDALRIAAYAAAGASVTCGFSGDLTQLWYEQLDLSWRARPEALAGITTREGLFVLETLAADHRMRVIFRAEHAAAPEGRLLHRMRGPASALAHVTAQAAAGNWHAGVARTLAACPVGQTAASGECIGAPGAAAHRGTAAAHRGTALHSWVMAPRAMAAYPV